jgi:hypothetical protein
MQKIHNILISEHRSAGDMHKIFLGSVHRNKSKTYFEIFFAEFPIISHFFTAEILHTSTGLHLYLEKIFQFPSCKNNNNKQQQNANKQKYHQRSPRKLIVYLSLHSPAHRSNVPLSLTV